MSEIRGDPYWAQPGYKEPKQLLWPEPLPVSGLITSEPNQPELAFVATTNLGHYEHLPAIKRIEYELEQNNPDEEMHVKRIVAKQPRIKRTNSPKNMIPQRRVMVNILHSTLH